MDNTTVNGIVLDDSISNCLLKLQNNRAASLAELLDDSIGFLLEYSGYFYDNSKTFLDILATLHNARTEFLGLIPNQLHPYLRLNVYEAIQYYFQYPYRLQGAYKVPFQAEPDES